MKDPNQETVAPENINKRKCIICGKYCERLRPHLKTQ